MGYTVSVSTGLPVELPVSVDDVKEHTYVDDAADDELLDAYIESATDEVSRMVPGGRQLVTRTWDYVLPAFPSGSDPLYLPRPPLVALVDTTGNRAIQYYDGANALTFLATTSVIVHTPWAQQGYLRTKPSTTWPSANSERDDAVTIRYTAGYGLASAVPQSLRQAIRLLVADAYENRGEGQTPKYADATLARVRSLLCTNAWGFYA